MNNLTCCGRVVTIPRIKLIPLNDLTISVCTFVIALYEGLRDESEEYDDTSIDFIECIAFSEVANFICNHFLVGSKVILSGKLKNYRFEDINRTKHFTQIYLVNHAEYGDSSSVIKKIRESDKSLEASIDANMKSTFDIFTRICESGFLCVDEESYYRLALSSQIIY